MEKSQIFAIFYPVGMFVLCMYQNLALYLVACRFSFPNPPHPPFLSAFKRGNEGKEKRAKRETALSLLIRICHRRPVGVYSLPYIA